MPVMQLPSEVHRLLSVPGRMLSINSIVSSTRNPGVRYLCVSIEIWPRKKISSPESTSEVHCTMNTV